MGFGTTTCASHHERSEKGGDDVVVQLNWSAVAVVEKVSHVSHSGPVRPD